MDQLTLGVFSPSVLLEVARATGRLADADLEVRDVPVPSSPAQFTSLRAGDFDAVFTSPDNVLAYRFLPANPLGELLDVEIVAGIDRGLGLCLGVRPGLTDPTQLRGGRLGVDVPNSGFAFVAYALLDELGISRDELEIVALGSTPKRANALHSGGCDVTVLNAGNELVARTHGCVLLADVTRLGPYLGTVVARLRQAPGVEQVDRLVVVLSDTAGAIIAGEFEDEAREAAGRLLGLPADTAAEHVALLRDPLRGLIADGGVDEAALATLVNLRRRFLPVPELDDISAEGVTRVRRT
jgi:ABC-type nitrate/sulfonate/bicarbonate transport system substrate-binding protein